MAVKAIEKAKAQKILNKIQVGSFDENDIDGLFMRMRAYSGPHRVFREVADFVAHNDARDRGIINDSLEAFYLSFKYFLAYSHTGEKLNISEPIPLYVKKLMKFQVDKCTVQELKEKFNASPDRLKKRLETFFTDDKKSKTTTFKPHLLTESNFAVVEHLLGFIGAHPAFTGVELMRDLLGVLRLNKLEFEEDLILKQQSTVIICVMLLMHQSEYKFDDAINGSCSISVENSSVIGGMPDEGPWPTFGGLEIHGVVRIARPDKDPAQMAYTVFRSGLSVDEFCDPSLIRETPLPNAPGLFTREVVLDGDLGLLESGKIGLLNL